MLKLRDKLKAVQEELDSHRQSSESASGAANASERRVASAEEEANRLRSEAKTLRSALAAAQREADEQRSITNRALADVEAAEAAQAEAESSLGAARSAEAAAHRILTSYEEQIRELRQQLGAVQASAGSREDELRRDLDDMTAKWLRAQAAAEENGLMALAQAFGLNVPGLTAAGSFPAPGAGGATPSPGGVGSDGDAAGFSDGANPATPGKAAASQRLATSLGAALGAPATPRSQSSGGGGGAAASITEALIGQLAALQSELQTKRDAWAAQRASLQARVAAAEAAVEAADVDVKRAEASAAEASNAAAGLRTELIAMRGARARSDAEASLLADKLRDAEARLLSLSAANDAAQRQLAEMGPTISDLRLRVEEHAGARSASSHMVSVLKDQLTGAQEEAVSYKREAASLQREVAALKAASVAAAGAGEQSASAAFTARYGPMTGRAGDGSDSPASASWLSSALTRSSSSAGGDGSGAPTSAVQATIQALERERDMMTEQVVALSGRLVQVEGEASGRVWGRGEGCFPVALSLLLAFHSHQSHHRWPSLHPPSPPHPAGMESQLSSARAQLGSLQRDHELLLELLGERDEELEELRGELEVVKDTFRAQLDTLLRDTTTSTTAAVTTATTD